MRENNNLRVILIGAFTFLYLTSTSLSAESRYGKSSSRSNNKQTKEINLAFPIDNDPRIVAFPPKWREDKFILSMDKEIVKEVSNNKDYFHRAMAKTYDMDMLMKPIRKPFHSIDKIYISSEFTTTLIFPSRYSVVSNFASVPLKTNTHYANAVTVQAGRDFVEGNIVVTLTDKTQNKLAVVMLRRYIPGMENDASEYGIKYANTKQFVSSIITYRDLPKAEDDVLIEAMYDLYGDSVKYVFKRDCDFETFMYDGIQFYAMRDDKFGEIEFDGINFRISNKYISCGEQTSRELSSSNSTPLK